MSSSNEIAIKVADVSKAFILPHEKKNSIKSLFVSMFRGRRTYEHQQVLKNISFEIKKGEFLGIVGRNGSGKSTLLKLISQIYTPDHGSITVNGKLTPFIELGVGFNPDLTGRENVFLNGALLGFNREEMLAMYDEIVTFAELERFMDQKLKNYSSGMQVRLAFSIAIRANSDILVLDEVLAVGDEAFQRKCYAYFAELKRNKKTVILVTHSMDSVQQFCNRAILINDGQIVESGNPAKVAGEYMDLNNKGASTKKMTKEDQPTTSKYGISTKINFDVSSENLLFDINVAAKDKIEDLVVTFVINRDTGEMVYRWATEAEIEKKLTLNKNGTLSIHLEVQNIFPDGEYDVQVAVKKADRSITYALFNRILTYRLVNSEVLKQNVHWKPKESFTYEQN
jgi:ABC-2 type transport system ATP-binding protein